MGAARVPQPFCAFRLGELIVGIDFAEEALVELLRGGTTRWRSDFTRVVKCVETVSADAGAKRSESWGEWGQENARLS